MESTQNFYHFTRQNIHFVQAPYNKDKNKKRQLRSPLTTKHFDPEMMFFRLNWGEITSYVQKYFGETNNRLCKVSTA